MSCFTHWKSNSCSTHSMIQTSIAFITCFFLDFSESWNHHSLSSEHNHTPYQLMLLGLRNCPSQAQLSFTSSAAQPLSPHLSTTQHVEVPRSNFNPCYSLLSQLGRNVNPLQECSDFGRDLYNIKKKFAGLNIPKSMCSKDRKAKFLLEVIVFQQLLW